jgi:hypothetical protein
MMITPSPLNRVIPSTIPGAVVTRNSRGQNIVTDKNKLLNFIKHVHRRRDETISERDAEKKYKVIKKLALDTETWMIGAMEGANIENPKGISWKHIDGGIKTRAYAVLEAKARVENCCLENAMDSWVAELFLADACHTRYNQYRGAQGLSGRSRLSQQEVINNSGYLFLITD